MSFAVPPGQVYGFLGPNGAGKTTAMRAVFGLIELDAGTVEWNSREISLVDKKHFGYMPEERGLYPKMRILDHLVYLARLHGIDRVQAVKRAHRLIEQLQIQGGASGKIEALSLGNRQRCQIAATLIHEPELIVLDEPFSGLDPISVEAVRNILTDQANSGKTVLFSSHQLEVVEDFCESVAIVDHGRVIVADRVENLTKSSASLVVKVKEDPNGEYLKSIKGLSVTKGNDGSLQVEILDGASPQDILFAAIRAGTLEKYEFARKPLSSVFKAAISSANSATETV